MNCHEDLWPAAKACGSKEFVDSSKELVDSSKDLWKAARMCEQPHKLVDSGKEL